MVTGVERLFESAVIKLENDRVENGLIVCGTCGAPKQRRVRIGDRDQVIPDVCLCERKRREDEAARLDAERRAAHVAEWRRECFRSFGENGERIGEKMRFPDGAAGPVSEAEATCRKYAERFGIALGKNYGIALYGDVGTGKSHLAGCICNKVIEEGYTAVFGSLSRIAQKVVSVKEAEREEATALLRSPDLFVFDDFGVERRSEYMDEAVGTAVDIRYGTGKPVIVTTNMMPEDFRDPGDIARQRVFSRLIEMCSFIPVKGPDRRADVHNAKARGFRKDIG